MKVISRIVSKFIAIAGVLLGSLAAAAQDKKMDVDISVTKHDNWYSQPWVWIVGAAIFLLLLVTLLRNNSTRS